MSHLEKRARVYGHNLSTLFLLKCIYQHLSTCGMNMMKKAETKRAFECPPRSGYDLKPGDRREEYPHIGSIGYRLAELHRTIDQSTVISEYETDSLIASNLLWTLTYLDSSSPTRLATC